MDLTGHITPCHSAGLIQMLEMFRQPDTKTGRMLLRVCCSTKPCHGPNPTISTQERASKREHA